MIVTAREASSRNSLIAAKQNKHVVLQAEGDLGIYHFTAHTLNCDQLVFAANKDKVSEQDQSSSKSQQNSASTIFGPTSGFSNAWIASLVRNAELG